MQPAIDTHVLSYHVIFAIAGTATTIFSRTVLLGSLCNSLFLSVDIYSRSGSARVDKDVLCHYYWHVIFDC
jgi:hypothetical protein